MKKFIQRTLILFVAVSLLQACTQEQVDVSPMHHIMVWPGLPETDSIGSILDNVIVIDTTINNELLLSEQDVEDFLLEEGYILGDDYLSFAPIYSSTAVPAFLKALEIDTIGNSCLPNFDSVQPTDRLYVPSIMMYLVTVNNERSIFTSAIRGKDLHILSTTNFIYDMQDVNLFFGAINAAFSPGLHLDRNTLDSIVRSYLEDNNSSMQYTWHDFSSFKKCMWTLSGGGGTLENSLPTPIEKHLLTNSNLLLTHPNTDSHDEVAYNAAILLAQILCYENYKGFIGGFSGYFDSSQYNYGINLSNLMLWVEKFHDIILYSATPGETALSILKNLNFEFSDAHNSIDVISSLNANRLVINTQNWTLIEGYDGYIDDESFTHIHFCEYKNFCKRPNFNLLNILYYDFSCLRTYVINKK